MSIVSYEKSNRLRIMVHLEDKPQYPGIDHRASALPRNMFPVSTAAFVGLAFAMFLLVMILL